MWYGIYKGLEHTDINCSNNIIVSFRFDYFSISSANTCVESFDGRKIIQFLENNLHNTNINFINEGLGCDNLYMGRYNKIKALIEKFHFKLDDILNMNKEVSNQELLVNIIAKQYNEYYIHCY